MSDKNSVVKTDIKGKVTFKWSPECGLKRILIGEKTQH